MVHKTMAIDKSRINLLSLKTLGHSENYYCISRIVLDCMDEVTTEPHSTSTKASIAQRHSGYIMLLTRSFIPLHRKILDIGHCWETFSGVLVS